MTTQKSAGVVVFRRKPRRYLVLLKKKHTDFPKGKLESKETNKDAALRELVEETGLQNVKLISGFAKTRHYTFEKNNKKIQKTVTFFLGETDEDNVHVSKEHHGFLWLSPTAAVRMLKYRNYKTLIQQAEEFLKRQTESAR